MARSRSDSGGSDNPPSYEESIASAPPIDSNLTWPNSVVTRDEVSTFLQMALTQAIPENTEPTRGRAYTVTGAPEPHKHRNIINYFENSLDDVDSIDWSHHSIRHLPRQYSENQMFDSTSSNRLNNTTKPHNQGNRIPSRDIIHWQYVKDEHSNCSNPSLECNQRPSPTSQYPSARREEGPSPGANAGEGTRFNVQPVNNSRETHSETDVYYTEDDQVKCPSVICGSHSLGALTPLIEEQRPVFSVSEGAIIDTNSSLDERHPSAPSVELYTHMTSTPNCTSIYPNIDDQMMTHTTPGRLDEIQISENFEESEQKSQKSPEKNVSFWVGNDENICPNKTVVPNFEEHYIEKDFGDRIYKRLKEIKSDPVIYQQPPVNPDYLNNIVYEIPVKNCHNGSGDEDVFEDPLGPNKMQSSELQEDCKHPATGQTEIQLPDHQIPVTISSIIIPSLPFKQSDEINRTDSGFSEGCQSSQVEKFLPRDKSVTFSDDTKDGEDDLSAHLINQSDPEADGVVWDGNVYYRSSPQKTNRRVGWRRWAAISFFVFDLLTMLLGLALLLVDYHSNIAAGFALMGIGAGLCIPALNYLGGFPTVCG